MLVACFATQCIGYPIRLQICPHIPSGPKENISIKNRNKFRPKNLLIDDNKILKNFSNFKANSFKNFHCKSMLYNCPKLFLRLRFHMNLSTIYALFYFTVTPCIQIQSELKINQKYRNFFMGMLTYGIYARVHLFSQNEQASATNE